MSIPVVRGVTNGNTAPVVWTNGAASQFIDMTNLRDEEVVLLVRNDNASAGQIATVTIVEGDGLAGVRGNHQFAVAIGGEMRIAGPFEGARFANMANSRVTITLSVAAAGALASVRFMAVSIR